MQNMHVEPVAQKHKNKIRTGSLTADILIYGVMGIIALVTVFPFVYIISASISDPLEVVAGKVWFLPIGFSLKSYTMLFSSSQIWRSFANSIFFTVIITVLNVANSMLAGFSLCKKNLVFRKGIVFYLLVPMYFSGGLIPTFVLISKLKLFNTLYAIILPSIASVWNIILARTFIKGLPDALRESAIIDGASELTVFGRIILPLSKPIIAVLTLYTALGVWNSWFNYMIYIPKLSDWMPLQMYLTKVLIWGDMSSTMQVENLNPELVKQKLMLAAVGSQLKYSVMVVATVPIMIVYPFVQKYFIQGVMLGSLKE